MFVWLFLLFVALPITEIFLLLKVGAWLGVWKTVGLIVFTAFVGASVWRSQGSSIIWAIRDKLSRNEMPARELLEGVLILVGGVFFLTPGFITDTAGFLFLIPMTRTVILNWLKEWLKSQVEKGNIDVYVSGGPFDSSD